MISVSGESRTRSLEHVGRTEENITNIDPKTVERTTTDDSPTAVCKKGRRQGCDPEARYPEGTPEEEGGYEDHRVKDCRENYHK